MGHKTVTGISKLGTTTRHDAQAAERHYSRLIGTASKPDMHNIRIIGFFFANRLLWQIESSAVTTYSIKRIKSTAR
jgi:hypothetical protein